MHSHTWAPFHLSVAINFLCMFSRTYSKGGERETPGRAPHKSRPLHYPPGRVYRNTVACVELHCVNVNSTKSNSCSGTSGRETAGPATFTKFRISPGVFFADYASGGIWIRCETVIVGREQWTSLIFNKSDDNKRCGIISIYENKFRWIMDSSGCLLLFSKNCEKIGMYAFRFWCLCNAGKKIFLFARLASLRQKRVVHSFQGSVMKFATFFVATLKISKSFRTLPFTTLQSPLRPHLCLYSSHPPVKNAKCNVANINPAPRLQYSTKFHQLLKNKFP